MTASSCWKPFHKTAGDPKSCRITEQLNNSGGDSFIRTGCRLHVKAQNRKQQHRGDFWVDSKVSLLLPTGCDESSVACHRPSRLNATDSPCRRRLGSEAFRCSYLVRGATTNLIGPRACCDRQSSPFRALSMVKVTR